MLDVVDAGRRLEVFIEGKDLETRRFFLTVTPRDSGEDKFAYAGSVEELTESQRKVGDRIREAVLVTLQAAHPMEVSTAEIVALLQADGMTLSQDTVARHCQALVTAKQARWIGTGKRDSRFVAIASPQGPFAEKNGGAA
jgi:hypothetical protein